MGKTLHVRCSELSDGALPEGDVQELPPEGPFKHALRNLAEQFPQHGNDRYQCMHTEKCLYRFMNYLVKLKSGSLLPTQTLLSDYPTVQLDSSETTKSGSSDEAAPVRVYYSASTKETETELSSEEVEDEIKNSCLGKSSFFQQRSNSQKSHTSSDTTASTTTDTKTYTLICSSDVESTKVNTSHPPSVKFLPKNDSKDGLQLEDGDKVAECFSQLYNRIYRLEDLLRSTIKKSVSAEEHKCFEKIVGDMAKPEKLNINAKEPKLGKTKTKMGLAADVSKGWESTRLSIPEDNKEEENSDTDSELKHIKNRLNMLENKLRKTQKLSLSRNYQEPLTSSSLVFAGTDGSCNAKDRNISKKTKATAPFCCNAKSAQRSETTPSNSEKYFCEKKVKSNKTHNARCRNEKILKTQFIQEEVRKTSIPKCTNEKKKCSSIVNTSGNPPLKPPTASGWKKLLYQHSVVTEESLATTLLSQSFSTKIQTDSSTAFFLKCQNDGPLQPLSKPSRKKKLKKRKHLSKTNSKTNIFSSQSAKVPSRKVFLDSPPNPAALNFEYPHPSQASALKLSDENSELCPSTCDDRLCKGVTAQLPSWKAFWISPRDRLYPHSIGQKQKSLKKQISFRNPLEILKRNRKIKIPILFQELCKTSNKKEPPKQELSNSSMRLVIVEEDNRNPLTPFRRLIKKLSHTKPLPKPEQFVFGVFKCQCSSQSCDWVGFVKFVEALKKQKRMKAEARTEDSGGHFPTLSHFHLAFIVLVCLLALHRWRHRRFYRLAALIDGPRPLPLIGNALEYLALDHVKILDYLLDITTKYNGLARVWLGGLLLVHISRPEDAEILLSSHKLIEKNRMYRFFDDVLGQGLLNAKGDVWRKHRKIIAPTFHPSILKHFVKIFSEQSRILVKVLEKNADGRIFNVFPYVRNCALDFITETALENHIGAQLRVVAPATRAAERLMNITYNRMFKLWLYSDFIFYRTQQGKEYLRLRDLVKESTEPLLEVKKKEVAEGDLNRNNPEGIKRKSFFRQLVELNENADNFNDKELRDEVVTMIITGYETTAATVGFILVMLGIHQDVQARVYEEVVAMQELLKGRELETEDLVHFEYMDRVIKETLRLYPVGPIIFRECTSDVKLTTCTIPKGASVAVVILKMHRDPAIWDNPNTFDPDHFLPEKSDQRHPYAYIPFSAGPRNCIGKQYAYLSMRVMLFHILSNYRVLCDLRDEDIRIKSEVTMKMVGGFKIRLLPRRQTDDE